MMCNTQVRIATAEVSQGASEAGKTYQARQDEVILHAHDLVGSAVLFWQIGSGSDPFDDVALHEDSPIGDLLLLLVEGGQHTNVLQYANFEIPFLPQLPHKIIEDRCRTLPRLWYVTNQATLNGAPS